MIITENTKFRRIKTMSVKHYVLSEAAKSELSSVESIREDAVEHKFESAYTEMDELPEELMYAEDAIPIFNVNGTAVVEHDMLAKFMECNYIEDVEEAVDRLREYYNIDTLAVAVDSYDTASAAMSEAKMLNRTTPYKKGLVQMEAQMTLFDKLKKKGIPMFKKKNKKKTAPKKKAKKK